MITYHLNGQDGRRALTRDKSGANLPAEFAPWDVPRIVRLDDGDPKEAEMMASVRDQGYFLYVRDGG